MPLSLLAGHLPVVVFSPESMDLPEAAPTKRRRLIDVLLAQIEPGYTKRLLKYNHVVKARNKLLDRIKFGKGEVGELTFWDEQLVELGGAIITLRQKYARTLDSRIKKCFKRINNAREKEQKIAFYYQSSIQDVDRFREELENARERELRVQFVLTRQADAANNQDIILRLDERVPETSHFHEYKTARYLLRRSFTSDFDF